VSAELAALVTDPSRVAHLEPDAIPAIVGELEVLKAQLWVRLQAPPVGQPGIAPAAKEPDRLLTAKEAGELLGVGSRWLYRHADDLPFTRRLTGGTVRFSARGLERWKETRR
jgi:excisionase family DNA binding protein